LYLCCFSTALFVSAAICPHVLPKSLIKPFQNSFILVAFPLVGVRNNLSLYSIYFSSNFNSVQFLTIMCLCVSDFGIT
jgi:hypothetical protein